MLEIIFYIAIFFIMLDARISLILSRSYINRNLSNNIGIVAISFIASISSLSLVIWGFINLVWWIPIISILLMSLVAGILINQRTLGFFISVSSLINVIIIFLTAYIWIR